LTGFAIGSADLLAFSEYSRILIGSSDQMKVPLHCRYSYYFDIHYQIIGIQSQ